MQLNIKSKLLSWPFYDQVRIIFMNEKKNFFHLLLFYDQIGDVIDGSEAESVRHANLTFEFIYES